MSTTATLLAKLAKVLGMLGSAHDGEIASAGRQAERIRKEIGKSWSEMLQEDDADSLLARIAAYRASTASAAAAYQAARASSSPVDNWNPGPGWTKEPGSWQWRFTHPPKDWDVVKASLDKIIDHCAAALTPTEVAWAKTMCGKKGRPRDQFTLARIRATCAAWWAAKYAPEKPKAKRKAREEKTA